MVDVRAHREAFRFQAGSAATITVTAANADGDPVDLTSHTLTLTPNGETPIAATTADPEVGTRVFSFDADDTALLDDAGKGSISLADGDGDEWIVGSAWASTVGTTSQDHEVSVVLGSANIAVTVAAYIGAGGGGADLSDDDPEPLGATSPGTSTEAARSDHVHPPNAFHYAALFTPTALGEADDFITGTTFTTAGTSPVGHTALVFGTSNDKDGGYVVTDSTAGTLTFERLPDSVQPLAMVHFGKTVGVAVDLSTENSTPSLYTVVPVAPDDNTPTLERKVSQRDVRIYFQRADVRVTTDDEYTMTDSDRIVITAGSQVTLPSAESMAGQEVTIFAAGQGVTVLPAEGETVLGLPSFTMPTPPPAGQNSVKFVAVDASAFGIGWSWAQTLRQGPAWDLPNWDGVGEGRILATSESSQGQPIWIPAGTSGQVMMWRAAPGPDDAPSPGFVDVSELDVQSEDVAFTGTGLFVGTGDVNGGIQRAEGTLDRWMFVSAFATTNVDLSSLMGPSEVVTQPTLDGGAVPVRGSDVWLFGQTNPEENGAYLVGFDDTDGIWTKYVHPNVFDPPGNGYRVTCNADGTDVDGVTFMWVDDDQQKSRRAAVNDVAGQPYSPSASGRWLRFGPPSDDLTTDPASGGGGGVAYGQDEGTPVTATTLTSLLDSTISVTAEPGDVFRITAGIVHANNSGSAKTHQVALYLDGQQIGSAITGPSLNSGSNRQGILTGEFRVNTSTTATGSFWGLYPTGQPPMAIGSVTVSDLGTPRALDVRASVQSGGSQSVTLEHLSVVKVPAA